MLSIEAFTWSNRCYRALLSFYPAEFRVRFGKEMVQVFHDCCRDQAGKRGGTGLARLWLETLRDLSLSIPRERIRVLLKAEEFTARTAGLVDSIVIGTFLTEAFFFGFRKVPFTCTYLQSKLQLAFFAFVYLNAFTI
jgi:hypothetical protein